MGLRPSSNSQYKAYSLFFCTAASVTHTHPCTQASHILQLNCGLFFFLILEFSQARSFPSVEVTLWNILSSCRSWRKPYMLKIFLSRSQTVDPMTLHQKCEKTTGYNNHFYKIVIQQNLRVRLLQPCLEERMCYQVY